MFATPGKKLLFMGADIGQWDEWHHDRSIDWHLLEHGSHRGVQQLVRRLNELARNERALHELDCRPDGFEWIEANDGENSALAFFRKGGDGRPVVCVLNFTPVVRRNYRLGVPRSGRFIELLNSDAREYGGSGQGNLGAVEAAPIPYHGRPWSVSLTLPPLAALYLTPG
jgi:1,4-alpha-glucan branching enzyme